jgi:6-phosphogluconate dehydrogenase
MQLAVIGLGRMGASMVRRLLRDGHACVVHDVQPSAVAALVKDGATGAKSLKEMVSQLVQPRTIWLMVPAPVVDQALGDLVPLLDAGDIVIDGGNSYYRDDMRRGAQLLTRGIQYLDVGTSGGVSGLERGYCLLRSANLGQRDRQAQSGHDAETTPLRDPELYRFEMNLPEIAEVWRRGSVIGSWLLDLTATALLKDPELAGYGGRVSDSGEGRWTIQAAIDEGVPVPVLSAALFERFASRGNADFANRVLSAMRYEFGSHVEKPAP